MSSTETKMYDPPELVLEKILSYLSLADRLRSRAVSKRWCQMIDRLKVNTLCYSERPIGFLIGKSRFVSTFICSPRFESFFFSSFGRSLRDHLRRLHLCNLNVNGKETAFTEFLSSFDQLEELNIISLQADELKLKLQMLNSIQLREDVSVMELTLDTPRLKTVHLESYPILNLIHESVETLYIDTLEFLTDCASGEPLELSNQLGNLKSLYFNRYSHSSFSFLLRKTLQMKNVYVFRLAYARNLIIQMSDYPWYDLSIYFCGMLVNGLDDPLFDRNRFPQFGQFRGNALAYLSERLTILPENLFPLRRELCYLAIERIPVALRRDLLKRFTDFDTLTLRDGPVEIPRFLDFLRSSHNIAALETFDQPPDLFNRLPDHCAVQKLIIRRQVLDPESLFRLKHLIHLKLSECSFDIELIRRFLKELQFLCYFQLIQTAFGKGIEIRIKATTENRKQFAVCIGCALRRDFTELNDAIKFIVEN